MKMISKLSVIFLYSASMSHLLADAPKDVEYRINEIKSEFKTRVRFRSSFGSLNLGPPAIIEAWAQLENREQLGDFILALEEEMWSAGSLRNAIVFASVLAELDDERVKAVLQRFLKFVDATDEDYRKVDGSAFEAYRRLLSTLIGRCPESTNESKENE